MHKETEKWDKCPECFIVSKSCSLQWLFTTHTLKKSTQGIGLCYSPGGYSQSSDHTKVARETGFPPCTSLSLVSIIPPIRHILSANIWGTNRGQSFAQHYQNKRSTKQWRFTQQVKKYSACENLNVTTKFTELAIGPYSEIV